MHDSGVIGRGHSDFSHTPADTTSRFNTLPVESGSGNAHSGDDIGLQVQIVQGPGAERPATRCTTTPSRWKASRRPAP